MARNSATIQSPNKVARTGAKSCTECRRRKIRCIWAAHDATKTSCNACLASGRACVPQAVRTRGTAKSSKTRITELEQSVSALRAMVENPRAERERSDTGLKSGQHSYNFVEHRPSHLELIFGNAAGQESQTHTNDRCEGMHEARQALIDLIPSADEVNFVSGYANAWMALYYALFPSSFGVRTGDQLLGQRESLSESHSVRITLWLLSFVITLQQAPTAQICGQESDSYIDCVLGIVNKLVTENISFIESAEGMEVMMLFIRLTMAKGDMHQTWMAMRRVIAIAELADYPQSKDHHRLLVWESICATDRNFSMMLNLPPGTARYASPINDSNFASRRTVSSFYNYRLSNVCAMVFEIDEAYSHQKSAAECFEKVLRADRLLSELRHEPKGDGLPGLLVQFWHCYIAARVHLRPAMTRSSEYSYSQDVCVKACEDAARLFPQFRLFIPAGFFVCRILDLQVFTVISVLLLISTPSSERKLLADRVLQSFAEITHRLGSDFATQASSALLLLRNLSDGQAVPSTKINIPLLGNIDIGSSISSPSPNQIVESSSGGNPFRGDLWAFTFDDGAWLADLSSDMLDGVEMSGHVS